MEPVAIMASKKSVNAENLAALGAQRLAAILMDLAEHDAETKRRLRLELAGQAGGEIIAAEISKRLTSLKSARSFVDWHKRRDFVKDLDLQRAMIRDRLAPTRPDLALDLMWRFLDLAEPVLHRVDDSTGTVGDVFRAACNALGAIATAATPDPARLAERVFAAVTHNDYGVLDNLVRAICPALGEAGMAQLKARLTAAQAKRPATDRHDGRSYALRAALQDIADAEGNVDAYIALVPASVRKQPGVAAEIGHRLLKAGRAQEALAALEPAAPKRHGSYLNNDDLYYPGYEGPNGRTPTLRPWMQQARGSVLNRSDGRPSRSVSRSIVSGPTSRSCPTLMMFSPRRRRWPTRSTRSHSRASRRRCTSSSSGRTCP